MISGWSKLQVSLGSESHGWGTFTPASPSIASRSLGKEQSFSLCQSYGNRGVLEPHNDSMPFPEPKATLVESLVGALINATEILDGYAHPSSVSAAFKGFLGFEALSQEHNFALATSPGHAHALQHGEPLQLVFHERLSYGNSELDAIASPDINAQHVSLWHASNAHALHSASASSSALHSENISRGHPDRPVNTINSADHGYSHHSRLYASSEEDILLQEARFKAFRNESEGDAWKGLRKESTSSDGPVKIVDAHSEQAKDVSKCKTHTAIEGHAESGKYWSLAGFMTLSKESSLFWGGIALSMFLAGAFLVTCRSSSFMRGQLQKPSVKRRILKSQWYGSPGSQSWGHRNFQMRLSEFPKYPILEVDGDRKQLRFPANSTGSNSAGFSRSGYDLPSTNATHGNPARQTTDSESVAQMSMSRRHPIRQTIHGSKALRGQQHMLKEGQPHKALHEKDLLNVEWSSQLGTVNDCREIREERTAGFTLPGGVPANNRTHGKMTSHDGFPSGGLNGRRVSESGQENTPTQRASRAVSFKSRIDQSQWGKEDELDLDRRIQKLYETIQAVEQHRRSAMLALEEERQRSMALEEEMVKQREASAVLGEEVRLLKESHNALLTSLRKKYSTSAAVRTAADLVYQDWERQAAVEK